jgi:hypothetical protein
MSQIPATVKTAVAAKSATDQWLDTIKWMRTGNPVLDAALFYGGVQNIPVFALHPTVQKGRKGYQEGATTDPAKIRQEWAQRPGARVATVSGPKSGLVIIDLDVKDGKDGPGELRRLQTIHGGLPRTLAVMTPSRGVHFYFKAPAGVDIRNSVGEIAPGIDVRGGRADGSHGGVIPLPPSPGTKGGRYEWWGDYPGDFKALPEPPPWLLFLMIFKKRDRARLADLGVTGPESFNYMGMPPAQWEPWARALLRNKTRERYGALPDGPLRADIAGPLLRYVEGAIGGDTGELQKIETATEGSRDTTINNSGMQIWSLLHGLEEFGALSDQLVHEVRERFLEAAGKLGTDQDGTPFIDIAAEKWERTCFDADARDLSCALRPSAEQDFAKELAEHKAETVRKSRVRWVDDTPLVSGIDWLVEDFIPKAGIGFLAAHSGKGKTFLLVDLALCLSYGLPFFGRQIGNRGGTHIVAAEGAYGVPHRVRAALTEKFAKGQDGAKVPVTFHDAAPNLLTVAGVKAFIEEMKTVAGEMQQRHGVPLRLLGIDTFSQAFSVSDENDAAIVGQATRAMQAIATALGIAVISLHHLGKDPSKGMRGSSVLRGNSDFVALVKREGELFLDKCREAEDGIVLGHFEIPKVIVGVKPDGTPITSRYVSERAWPAAIEEEAKRTKDERALLDALDTVLAKKGELRTPPGETEPQHVARVEDVRAEFYARHGGEAAARRQAFNRARKGLSDKLRDGGEWIWAVKQEI